MTKILNGVVGAGQMGAGIAEACARAGLDVLVSETDEARAEAVRERAATSLGRALRRGKAHPPGHDRALAPSHVHHGPVVDG